MALLYSAAVFIEAVSLPLLNCSIGSMAAKTPIAKIAKNRGAYNALRSPALRFGGTLFPIRPVSSFLFFAGKTHADLKNARMNPFFNFLH